MQLLIACRVHHAMTLPLTYLNNRKISFLHIFIVSRSSEQDPYWQINRLTRKPETTAKRILIAEAFEPHTSRH